MLQLNGFCIVSNLPVKIHRNSQNRLHNTSGPAIEFKDGYHQYYINGRAMPTWIFEKAAKNEITKEDFLKETNDEIRSGIYEVVGNERMMELLGAKEIDSVLFTHGNGEMETISLFRTSAKLNKVKNKPYAWIKRICPSTGTTYLTPTNPDFNTALDAAKFHRPSWVPMDVDYNWQSRS